MALRRSARIRFTSFGGRSDPIIGAGQFARHVQYAAFSAIRCEDGEILRAADAPGWKTSADLHLQQPVVRSCRAWVRLRLLTRLSENALSLGGAVRRFH